MTTRGGLSVTNMGETAVFLRDFVFLGILCLTSLYEGGTLGLLVQGGGEKLNPAFFPNRTEDRLCYVTPAAEQQVRRTRGARAVWSMKKRSRWFTFRRKL